VKRVLLFVVLAVFADIALGRVLDRLYRRTLTGERGGLTNYALTQDADLLVLGSSRAQSHVMPSVLGPRLSLRAYNAGLKGHGLLYSLSLFDLWRQKHGAPRAVVLNMDPETLLPREYELGATAILGPYFRESARVREVVYLGGPYKRLQYLSHSYRYNGKVLSIAKNLLVHPTAHDGFVAALGVIDLADPAFGAQRHGLLDVSLDVPHREVPSDAIALEVARRPFWEPKVRLLREVVEAGAKEGTGFFLVHAPVIGLSREAHDAWVSRMRTLATSMPSTEFFDLCQHARPDLFADKPELYRDFNHLNAQGALLFSSLLAEQLASPLPPRPAPVRATANP